VSPQFTGWVASPRRALLLGVSFYINAMSRDGRLTVRWTCGRATAFQGQVLWQRYPRVMDKPPETTTEGSEPEDSCTFRILTVHPV